MFRRFESFELNKSGRRFWDFKIFFRRFWTPVYMYRTFRRIYEREGVFFVI